MLDLARSEGECYVLEGLIAGKKIEKRFGGEIFLLLEFLEFCIRCEHVSQDVLGEPSCSRYQGILFLGRETS